MKSDENIRKLVKKLRVQPDAAMDARIRDNITRALEESKQPTSAELQPNIRRIIMKNRITKLATTAVIIIAMLIVLNKYSGPNHIGLVNVALAKASEALEEVSWVHITSSGKSNNRDYESETWAGNKSRVTVIRKNDGTIIFRDYIENLKYQYYPQTNEVVTSELTETFRPVPRQWEQFVDMFSRLPQEVDFSHQEHVVDGSRVSVYKVSWIEEGSVRRDREYTVDAESNLPLACNVRSLYSDGTILSEMRQLFEYTQKGPATIHEAGIPVDARFRDYNSESLQISGVEQSEIDDSAGRLLALGKALLVYANDHTGKYPDTLQSLEGHLDDLQWLTANVEYLGGGKKATDPPNVEMAYDRTLLERVGRTNILYHDLQVIFERPTNLR